MFVAVFISVGIVVGVSLAIKHFWRRVFYTREDLVNALKRNFNES